MLSDLPECFFFVLPFTNWLREFRGDVCLLFDLKTRCGFDSKWKWESNFSPKDDTRGVSHLFVTNFRRLQKSICGQIFVSDFDCKNWIGKVFAKQFYYIESFRAIFTAIVSAVSSIVVSTLQLFNPTLIPKRDCNDQHFLCSEIWSRTSYRMSQTLVGFLLTCDLP